MVPSGRKYSGKSAKPSVGDQAIRAYEFEQEDKKDLSGSEEDAVEADINKSLLAKRKRLEMYTKASLKTSNQKLENVWKTQQEQRQKLNQEYSQQFLTLFQQWDMDMQKAEEQEEKLASMEDLEKNHENLLTGAQNELKKEMALLQKKIMMETVSCSELKKN
ncbi:hypothetical protein G4228_014453 [Cervus hanglu yarkandensis]|nr:hypothetical protein G4228_014453 [Cervus hanglu yarkandensis]